MQRKGPIGLTPPRIEAQTARVPFAPEEPLARDALGYAAAPVAVRDDLVEAQRALLDHLRRPGSWFTGAERIAIAAESRGAGTCRLCRDRKAALSPEAVRGEHDRASLGVSLAPGVVDVAHRVRTDSGRLSRAWFEHTTAPGSGPAIGAYVEAVGVVALLAGVDFFCRALGVPPPALPSPLPGSPSRYTPRGLRSDVAWVPILAPEDAAGPEAELYDRDAPLIPLIARALSAVPDHVRVLQEVQRTHYLPLRALRDPKLGRAIDRMQIELVAARVSAVNECFY